MGRAARLIKCLTISTATICLLKTSALAANPRATNAAARPLAASAAPPAEPKPFDQRLNGCYFKINLLSKYFLPQDDDHAFQYVGGGDFARGPLSEDDQFWHLATGDREVLVDMKSGQCTSKSGQTTGMTSQKFVEEKLAAVVRAFEAQIDALEQSDQDSVLARAHLEKFEESLRNVMRQCQSILRKENAEGTPRWLSTVVDKTRSALNVLASRMRSGREHTPVAPVRAAP